MHNDYCTVGTHKRANGLTFGDPLGLRQESIGGPGALPLGEERDKAVRMGEFKDMADAYGCTEKETVGLLFKDLFA